MQICDPSDKEKGHYSIEISDGVQTHTRTFDLSGQGETSVLPSTSVFSFTLNHILSSPYSTVLSP